MKQVNILFIFAIIAVCVSLLNLSITVNKIQTLTGFAGNLGYANLTVITLTSINFSTDTINWGSGAVNYGVSNATLNTAAPGASNVTNGNWSGNTAGLILVNIGNINVSLNLSAGKTAAQFLGGTAPQYQWNISENKTSSCTNATGTNLSLFWNTSTTTFPICTNFPFLDNYDTLRIDILLVVPNDSAKGALSDTITASAI